MNNIIIHQHLKMVKALGPTDFTAYADFNIPYFPHIILFICEDHFKNHLNVTCFKIVSLLMCGLALFLVMWLDHVFY